MASLVPTVNEVVNRYRWIRGILLPIVVIALLFVPIFTPLLNNVRTDIFVGLMIAILLLMWDLLANQLDVSSMQFFSDAELAQEALKNIALQNKKPTRAHIIHYSGQNLHSILLALQRISEIEQIHVLLHHPDNAINHSQSEKIKSQLGTIPYHWEPKKVQVSYYSEPASVRGILLEDVALCIGWYVYETVPNPQMSDRSAETLIWGHNTGAVLVRSDSEAFAALRDFFMRTFGYLADETVSMDELRKAIDVGQSTPGGIPPTHPHTASTLAPSNVLPKSESA